MYMIASFESKFKTNHEYIVKIFQHYGLQKIQSSLYAGDLDNNERKRLMQMSAEFIDYRNNLIKLNK